MLGTFSKIICSSSSTVVAVIYSITESEGGVRGERIHTTFVRAFRVPDDAVNRERAPDIIIILRVAGEAWNEAVGREDAEVC